VLWDSSLQCLAAITSTCEGEGESYASRTLTWRISAAACWYASFARVGSIARNGKHSEPFPSATRPNTDVAAVVVDRAAIGLTLGQQGMLQEGEAEHCSSGDKSAVRAPRAGRGPGFNSLDCHVVLFPSFTFSGLCLMQRRLSIFRGDSTHFFPLHRSSPCVTFSEEDVHLSIHKSPA
jgi:hypothetical protein